MKLIKEIRRRVRNVALAVSGKEPLGPVELAPVKIELHQAKVETFRHGQTLTLPFGGHVPFDQVIEHTRREMAKDLGVILLENGAFKFEILEACTDKEQPRYILRLEIKVIRPEEGKP